MSLSGILTMEYAFERKCSENVENGNFRNIWTSLHLAFRRRHSTVSTTLGLRFFYISAVLCDVMHGYK